MALLDSLAPYQLEGPSNPYLVRAMQAVAVHDTPENRRELYALLLQSVLLLPTPVSVVEGMQGYWELLPADASMRLLTAQSSSGEPLLIAFTDIEALRAWRPEGVPYFLMRASDLLMLAARNNMPALILNPAGPISSQIARWEIERLSHGEIPESNHAKVNQQTVHQETRVLVGMPLEPLPEVLLHQLRENLSRQPLVLAGYLFQMILDETDIRLVVGIRLMQPLPDHQVREMMQQMLSNLRPLAMPAQPLDFLILEEGGNLLRAVERLIEPFFYAALGKISER